MKYDDDFQLYCLRVKALTFVKTTVAMPDCTPV